MSSIVGIGIDVVAIDRFQESLDRTPGLLNRVFTSNEAKLKIS
ncbi:MAG: holo-ACP synthase, partial [Actinomycetes bacterium]